MNYRFPRQRDIPIELVGLHEKEEKEEKSIPSQS